MSCVSIFGMTLDLGWSSSPRWSHWTRWCPVEPQGARWYQPQPTTRRSPPLPISLHLTWELDFLFLTCFCLAPTPEPVSWQKCQCRNSTIVRSSDMSQSKLVQVPKTRPGNTTALHVCRGSAPPPPPPLYRTHMHSWLGETFHMCAHRHTKHTYACKHTHTHTRM